MGVELFVRAEDRRSAFVGSGQQAPRLSGKFRRGILGDVERVDLGELRPEPCAGGGHRLQALPSHVGLEPVDGFRGLRACRGAQVLEQVADPPRPVVE